MSLLFQETLNSLYSVSIPPIYVNDLRPMPSMLCNTYLDYFQPFCQPQYVANAFPILQYGSEFICIMYLYHVFLLRIPNASQIDKSCCISNDNNPYMQLFGNNYSE